MTAASRIAISLSPKSDRALQSPAYLQNSRFSACIFLLRHIEGRRKKEEGRGK
ncbi:MAG: hypothetical protein HC894_25005, partial [Microcoleus sp. SM1_3_4]|nr:hypothetical protein [Microcoleus sp. SM1_3_4]